MATFESDHGQRNEGSGRRAERRPPRAGGGAGSPRALASQQAVAGKQWNLPSDFSRGSGTTKEAHLGGAIGLTTGPSRASFRNKSVSSCRSHQNSYSGLAGFNNGCTSGSLHLAGSGRLARPGRALQSPARTGAPDVKLPRTTATETGTASHPQALHPNAHRSQNVLPGTAAAGSQD